MAQKQVNHNALHCIALNANFIFTSFFLRTILVFIFTFLFYFWSVNINHLPSSFLIMSSSILFSLQSKYYLSYSFSNIFMYVEASIKSTYVSALDSFESDDYWLTTSSFTKVSYTPKFHLYFFFFSFLFFFVFCLFLFLFILLRVLRF